MNNYYNEMKKEKTFSRIEQTLLSHSNTKYLYLVKSAKIAQNISVIALMGMSCGNVLCDSYLDMAERDDPELYKSLLNIKIDYEDVFNTRKLARALEEKKYDVVCFDSMRIETLQTCMIKELISLIHSYGARVAVGNTYMTQFLCKPTDYGADVVYEDIGIYSASALSSGVIYTNDDGVARRIELLRRMFGGQMDFADRYALNKSVMMLPFHMGTRSKNIKFLAERIKFMPGVEEFKFSENKYMTPYVLRFKLKGGFNPTLVFMEKLRYSNLEKDLPIGSDKTFVTANYDNEIRLYAGVDNPNTIRLDIELILKNIYKQ
ncbi:MAG: hypothetical protein E7315_01350 [Clostridiales bacterium]|nr:hypothetical protein [Clostridiales bacterium]